METFSLLSTVKARNEGRILTVVSRRIFHRLDSTLERRRLFIFVGILHRDRLKNGGRYRGNDTSRVRSPLGSMKTR